MTLISVKGDDVFEIEGLDGSTPSSMTDFLKVVTDLTLEVGLVLDPENLAKKRERILDLKGQYDAALVRVQEDPECEGLCRGIAESYENTIMISAVRDMV
ncbi:MAG: hypothetical protein R3E13_05035 [Alphaproteobacteria bacterium]